MQDIIFLDEVEASDIRDVLLWKNSEKAMGQTYEKGRSFKENGNIYHNGISKWQLIYFGFK